MNDFISHHATAIQTFGYVLLGVAIVYIIVLFILSRRKPYVPEPWPDLNDEKAVAARLSGDYLKRKKEPSFIESLFDEEEEAPDDLFEGTHDQVVDKLTTRYPSNVVSCPQGVVTYVIPNTSPLARIGGFLGKEKIEERIKGLLAGNADISEEELRAALKSYMVFVLSYRRSGKSGRSGIYT